jgi:predicted nucleic acid-binding OB-fold protein
VEEGVPTYFSFFEITPRRVIAMSLHKIISIDRGEQHEVSKVEREKITYSKERKPSAPPSHL